LKFKWKISEKETIWETKEYIYVQDTKAEVKVFLGVTNQAPCCEDI
jgi:hypothetical protein